MRSSCFVFARSEDKACLRRNIALYAHLFDEVVILSPIGNKVDLEGFDCVEVGGDSHSGEAAVERMLNGMRFASSFDYDLYCFLEYDAVVTKHPEYFDGIQASIFKEKDVDRWSTNFYAHYPWVFSKSALKQFVEGMTGEPLCEGFTDRWIAPQLERMGIKIKNFLENGESYSQNTIHGKHEDDFIKALDGGAYAFHGVKSQRVVDLIFSKLK